MIELKGKYNTAKIFTDIVEQTAQSQIINLLNQEAFKNSKIRIMPDTHAGAGCVIGFTANLGNKIIPNLVGVDIGCGMHVTKFKSTIDLKELDNFIYNNIPHGNSVNKEISDSIRNSVSDEFIYTINHMSKITNTDVKRHMFSIGSLGGGNHFIEINEDSKGFKYLVIHSGSRNYGLQVAKYYQKLAESYMNNTLNLMKQTRDKSIGLLKQQKRNSEIPIFLDEFNNQIKKATIPKELCYLVGNDRNNYLEDMGWAQKLASLNRQIMSNKIISKFNIDIVEQFETIHNYISFDDNIIRKGAVSALKGEKLIIPINMRDGSIIAIGKGNEDWNNSAPHGAGRLMSRSQAKEKLNLDDYKETMKDIYSTSVKQSTLDEAPEAYKPIKEILKNIKDTVDVIEIIKPIYNFKA